MEKILSKETLNPGSSTTPLTDAEACERASKTAKKDDIDISNFLEISEIYNEPLSSTSISVATRPGTNEVTNYYEQTLSFCKKVAIKKIFKEDLKTEFQKRQAAQEFPLHCSLDHSNIVKGIEWTENDNEYILIMEYMNTPCYFQEKIDQNLTPIKNENKMKSYIKATLEALAYLHSNGIVHGDIKLENILVNKGEKGTIPIVILVEIVKLCDFGLSRKEDKENGNFYMEFPVGSHAYMAPEIKSHTYVTKKIDLWSLGIVLYKMAVAYRPTQVNNYKYGSGPIPFRRFDWKKRSSELQDLVAKMLEIDPEKRISAEEALQHPWFQT